MVASYLNESYCGNGERIGMVGNEIIKSKVTALQIIVVIFPSQ